MLSNGTARAAAAAEPRACLWLLSLWRRLWRGRGRLRRQDWGGRITELFPQYSGLPTVTEPPIGGDGAPSRPPAHARP
eukprot:SAG11_NODE_12561_length_697_cov_0.884615_1_plen_77_part_10